MEELKLELQSKLPQDISLTDFAAVMWENLDIGVALVGAEGEWVFINPKLCEIVGYSWQELKNMTFQDITTENDLYSDLNMVESIKAGNLEAYTLFKEYKHKLGHTIPIRLKVIPVGEGRGKMTIFLSQISPITKVVEESDKSNKIIKGMHDMSVKGFSSATVIIVLLIIILIVQLLQLG